MSYENPRAAILLRPIDAKVIGSGGKIKPYRAGKRVQVQRNPAKGGYYILWFSRSHVAEVADFDLHDTVQYTDRRPQR